MEPFTMRFKPEELEQLKKEAAERGYGNTTEYLRMIIRNREAVSDSSSDEENVGELYKMIRQMEERIQQLEAQIEE